MGYSIKEILEKIKRFYTDIQIEILFVIIIILVGFSAFGLGRISILDEHKENIKLLYNNNLDLKPSVNISGAVVASKSGKKYHYPWCSGSNRIKESNKIWFKSIQEAKRAGYMPAGNCKGLK